MFLLDIVSIPKDDPVAFTFFTGYMAMFAASVFSFLREDKSWANGNYHYSFQD